MGSYGKLESGPMMVFAAASPVDLYLSALITVDASTLKVASPQLFELPIMAVPVCLSGWEGEEDQAKIAEEWGEKMKELVPEVFTEVDAEVVEQTSDTKCKV